MIGRNTNPTISNNQDQDTQAKGKGKRKREEEEVEETNENIDNSSGMSTDANACNICDQAAGTNSLRCCDCGEYFHLVCLESV